MANGNILTRWIDGRIQAAMKVRITNAPWLLQTAEYEKWTLPDPSLYRNQMQLFRTVPPVMVAAEMVGKIGKGPKYSVKELNGEEEKDIPNHEAEQLLGHPNPLHGRAEFQNSVIMARLLSGNAYIWKNMASQNAAPDELWLIPQDRILPIPDDRLYLSHYLYDAYGAIEAGIRLEVWEVIHIKRYNPFNYFIGLSPLEALIYQALGYKSSAEWNTRLFAENNARLPGILAFKDLYNDTDWKRLQGQVTSAAQKRQLLMLNGVQKGGVEWMRASGTMQEMDFLGGLENQKQMIYDALAPGLSAMLAVNANEANSRVGEAVLRAYGVWPILEDVSDAYNKGLLPHYGDNLVGEFDDIRIADRAMELQEQQEYSNVHTVDEIRKEFYGDKPIGDDRGNLLPAEIKSSAFGGFGAKPETQPGTMDDNQQPDNTVDETAAKAIALQTWRRVALKAKPGTAVDFDSPHIDHVTKAAILSGLKACKSKAAVRGVFEEQINKLNEKAVPSALELKLLLETAIKAVQESE